MIDEPIELLLALNARGRLDFSPSPLSATCVPMARIPKDRGERVVLLADNISALISGEAVIPEASAYALFALLKEKAELISRLCGCSFEIENGGVFGVVENYDLMFYAAFLFCSAAYIKRSGIGRCGRLTFSSSGEKLFAVLEADVLENCGSFEFDSLLYCASLIEIGFFTVEEKGKFYAKLSSHRPDLSKLGLKNGIYLR